MTLFANGDMVDQITSAASPHNVLATGHGFISPVPVDRIEVSTNEIGLTVLGVFAGLLGGEPSLGTVEIPGYGGPGADGDLIDLDFACAFVTDPDRVHNVTQDTWTYGVQPAIEAAASGDELLVEPGIYVESIDFLGKAITVRAADPEQPPRLVSSSASAVTFASGEGAGSILDGLTLTGASGSCGGGAWINRASPTIRNCDFVLCTAELGGGLCSQGGSPTITDCRFGTSTDHRGPQHGQPGRRDLPERQRCRHRSLLVLEQPGRRPGGAR